MGTRKKDKRARSGETSARWQQPLLLINKSEHFISPVKGVRGRLYLQAVKKKKRNVERKTQVTQESVHETTS